MRSSAIPSASSIYGRLVVASFTVWVLSVAMFLAGIGGGATSTLFAMSLIALIISCLIFLTMRIDRPDLGPSWRREREAPLRATRPASGLPLSGSSAIVGTAESRHTASSPLAAVACVAFCVRLGDSASRPDTMLIDGVTLGFTVVTNDDQLIEIPRGRIDIITHGQPVSSADDRVARYLGALDPLRVRRRDADPFCHEHASEICIRVGDHVAVHNPLTLTHIDAKGWERGYRDAAQRSYAIEGTPCVEVLP